jgi:HEAT repeat protein
MVDWTPYLESLCNTYTQWWTFGTLKDVVEPKRFEFGLIVETVERDTQQRGKQEQKVERLSVLEGLQKYAPNHVLLVGRPGSGKSTALVRLLVATAQQALQNPHSQIPVLVELRTYNIYYKTSVLDLVQASLKRRKLRLNLETIEELLAQGRLLLLMDGINELPDDEARRAIKEFRLDYSDVPMVFTTRDLGVGGDLGIERKLELQSLTEAEVEKFVRECMPGGSEERLQQLRQRLRELGQTPFVMWMLYFIVQKTGTVPSGAGSAFREFTQLYERRSKDDAPVSDESRRWWSQLLEHLGFEMMQAQKPTDFRLTISKREAEDILTKVLDREKFDKPRDYALRWLDDLLKHHLIQVTSNDQIEFCHQLIQEYYAAESLLKVLTSSGRTSPPAPLLQGEGSKSVPPFPRREGGLGGLGLSDETLKREYLNYLKWTEPLALMLELVEDEAQAVRVVRLALEVYLGLGARLAGAVKPEWQEQTVGLVAGLEIPQLLKIQLLEITKSERTIPELVKALNHEDSDVRKSAAEALGRIGSDATIPGLVKALNDGNSFIARIAAEALGRIGSDSAIPGLVKALNHEDSDVRKSAAEALGKIDSDSAIPGLVKALNHKDSLVRWVAAKALGKIGSDSAIPELVKALNDENSFVRWVAAKALGKIGSDSAISKLVKALSHEDSSVRESVVEVLGKIDSDAAIPGLIEALKDENSSAPRIAAEALGRIGSIAAIPGLVQTLNHKDSSVRKSAAEALGKIGSDAAIPGLVKAFNHEDPSVRWRVAEALGRIGSDAVIPELVKALNHKDSVVRRIATHALGRIGSYSAISELVKALDHEDSSVRWRVIDALANIASYELLPNLLERLKIAEKTNLLNTISAIQNRCKFYNYTIAVSPLPQKDSKRETLTVPIDMQQYEEILSVISNMVTVMERNPKTFGGIEEEALRDHFLVQLNGQYKGQATGETFNKKGKTDILIRVDGKNIFIAECKFWGGEKKLKETLDQLLGYTTWQDTKLALLIFNRNKNFSAVLEQISEAMKNHPTFTQELSYPSETGFRFILHHPEDKNRELLLTVLAFEIPR